MKNLKTVLLFVVIFILGYAAGNLIPFSSLDLIGIFQSQQGNVSGSAQLQVTVLTDKNNSVPNLEVDLGDKPGPPSKGGVEITNEKGVAIFKIVPGEYVIYFNEGTFPKDLEHGGPQRVTVLENTINNATVILKTK